MSTPPNYPPPQDPGGYGAAPPPQQNNTPMILGIIGIVCWFVCSIASIVLGLIGQSKARELGQSDTLPKVAWIGGIVSVVLGIIIGIAQVAAAGAGS